MNLLSCLRALCAAAAILLCIPHAQAEKLTLTGSSTLAPLVTELSRRFMAANPGVEITVEAGGSSRGAADALAGKADIGMVSRALHPDEKSLFVFTIARDGIALVVHGSNPVKSLSRAQVIDILSGKTVNWKAVGGNDAPVNVCSRKPGHSSIEIVTHYFGLGPEAIKPKQIAGDNAEALRMLLADPNLLTYFSVGLAEDSLQKGQPVKTLPVDGVAATSVAVKNGSYPLARIPEHGARAVKLPLSFQLNLGFVLALLLALGVAGSAWRIAYEYEIDMDHAYNDQLAGTALLAEAGSAMWQLRYGRAQFMLGDAAAQRHILEEEPKWHALIAGRLDAFGKLRHSEEELRNLAMLRAEYARYIEARPRFFELWQAGLRDEAIAWSTLTITPYGAATVAAIARLAQIHEAENEELRLEALRSVAWIRRAVAAIIIALIALLAGGYWMGRRVLGPIRRLQDEAVTTVREQFGEAIDVSAAGNEVKALEMSLRAMTARFAAHVVELDHARGELAHYGESLESIVVARTVELEATVARMERQNREITLRNEMSDLLQSCISIQEAGAVIARFAPQLFAGASGAAYMATPGAETLVAVSRWGDPPPAESLAMADCWAIRRGKTHLVMAADTSLLCPHVNGLPVGGAGVCVPLSAHGEALGLLHMTCPEACEPGSASMLEKQELAEALAAQVGMALANLRLRETLHQQSIRDALTGLYNRRYLEGALPRELARAQRGNRPLAVFMLDVDHFKNFNDTHGHDAGDAVLKALGKALRDNCRQADIACRFGGEEFTLILPDADEPAAREWAERLMQRVRSMEVKANGQTLPNIAISMGLALLPQHGEDAETLLQAADLALYDAKHAGRDRLVVSGEGGQSPSPQPSPVKGEGAEPPLPPRGGGAGGEGDK